MSEFLNVKAQHLSNSIIKFAAAIILFLLNIIIEGEYADEIYYWTILITLIMYLIIKIPLRVYRERELDEIEISNNID